MILIQWKNDTDSTYDVINYTQQYCAPCNHYRIEKEVNKKKKKIFWISFVFFSWMRASLYILVHLTGMIPQKDDRNVSIDNYRSILVPSSNLTLLFSDTTGCRKVATFFSIGFEMQPTHWAIGFYLWTYEEPFGKQATPKFIRKILTFLRPAVPLKERSVN